MAKAADNTDVAKPTATDEQQAEVNIDEVGVKGVAAFFEKKIVEQSEEYRAAELDKKKKEGEASAGLPSKRRQIFLRKAVLALCGKPRIQRHSCKTSVLK
jgi:hypothetical protein